MGNGEFLLTSEIITEGHPAYLSDINKNVRPITIHRGAIIHSDDKRRMLPFIKSNFGKISEREMARRLDIGKTTVNRWCKELGFIIKKDAVNEQFFKTWGSEMAYILGYIFADGNINWKPEKSYRALTITASEKDKEHLEKIRLKLKSTKELLYSASTKSYRLIVNNKTICMDLMKLGLVPKKSLSIRFPNIPEKFLRHFIRGIIDGDGNVRYVKRKRSPYFEITISSGSKAFLEKMAEKISQIGINGKVRKNKNKVFVLQYSCRRGKFQQYKMALRAKGGG
jgi:intein-encoded DNA endonuclease-like protein